MIAPNELKHARMALGLTQKQLANLANVSQSLITKVESGRTDPTYTSMASISEAIVNFHQKKQKTAKELMTNKITSCTPSSPISSAIELMKKHNISQMPVMAHGKVYGSISESTILNALVRNVSRSDKIETIMDDPMPTVAKTTTIEVVSHILQYHPMILVADMDKIVGVITKADVLSKA